MNVLTIGNSLEKNTLKLPCLLKKISALSNSSFLIKIYFPYFSINGRPPNTPTQYAIIEPIKLPIAPKIIIQNNENCPAVVKYHANGITTSEGIGIQALSSAIKPAMPK